MLLKSHLSILQRCIVFTLEIHRKPHNRKSAVTMSKLHGGTNHLAFMSEEDIVLNALINKANCPAEESDQWSVSLQKPHSGVFHSYNNYHI